MQPTRRQIRLYSNLQPVDFISYYEYCFSTSERYCVYRLFYVHVAYVIVCAVCVNIVQGYNVGVFPQSGL